MYHNAIFLFFFANVSILYVQNTFLADVRIGCTE